MKLTKYGHACLVLEDQGSKLVIDPGVFTKAFGDLDAIVAIVITHVHGDHYSKDHLDAILKANPAATIFTVPEVSDDYNHANIQVVTPGHEASVEPFNLRFLGQWHAMIHNSLGSIHNTGVMVNDTFFYPGDSFTKPDKPVKVLAVPANAPWATAGDSMDYIAAVKPALTFPTHNALLSDIGHQVYDANLNHICQQLDLLFKEVGVGESLDF